jgi:hypothetical protein
MFHRWAFSRPALGLAACVFFAPVVRGQTAATRASEGHHRRGLLSQNDPNPFSHRTTIPFRVGDEDCVPGTQQHTVTLRIYNILSQVVAFAALADSMDASDSTAKTAPRRSITDLALACGAYVALWDGTRPPDHREAPPGVYMYQLLIDGHPTGMRKMVLTR